MAEISVSEHALLVVGEKEAALQGAFGELRKAWQSNPCLSYSERKTALLALRHLITSHAGEFIEAIDADFGCRSDFTTKLGDIFTMRSELDYMLARLRKWMKPSRRRVDATFQFGKAEVHYQALGVVAVIAPWNYPLRLALGPVAAALAAGNRVLLKPSEFAPRCGALIEKLVASTIDPNLVRVLLGGQDLAAAICRQPLDHVFFTGSTAVGKAVMQAASRNLTPVTLELGGKCPAILHHDFSVGRAAQRIIAGKLFNAGQTCMAPDHVWVRQDRLEATVNALEDAIYSLYPTLACNPDYTSIINDNHFRRVRALIDDALELGAQARIVNPAGESFDPNSRKIAPTVLWDIKNDMNVAREEIFGPVLPIRTYSSLEGLAHELRGQPTPLALYYFDEDKGRAGRLLGATRSGGACINDVILHAMQNDLPFGGVGASGMGKYHGVEGFRTFSQARGVFTRHRRNAASFLIPPYGDLVRRTLAFLTT